MRRARERGYLRRLGFGGSGVPCPCGKTLQLAQIVLVCPVIVNCDESTRTCTVEFESGIRILSDRHRCIDLPSLSELWTTDFESVHYTVIDAISQSHVTKTVLVQNTVPLSTIRSALRGVSQPRSCAIMHQARARYGPPGRGPPTPNNLDQPAGRPLSPARWARSPNATLSVKPTNAISCSHHTTCACTPVLVLALRAGAATAGASHG